MGFMRAAKEERESRESGDGDLTGKPGAKKGKPSLQKEGGGKNRFVEYPSSMPRPTFSRFCRSRQPTQRKVAETFIESRGVNTEWQKKQKGEMGVRKSARMWDSLENRGMGKIKVSERRAY